MLPVSFLGEIYDHEWNWAREFSRSWMYLIGGYLWVFCPWGYVDLSDLSDLSDLFQALPPQRAVDLVVCVGSRLMHHCVIGGVLVMMSVLLAYVLLAESHAKRFWSCSWWDGMHVKLILLGWLSGRCPFCGEPVCGSFELIVLSVHFVPFCPDLDAKDGQDPFCPFCDDCHWGEVFP